MPFIIESIVSTIGQDGRVNFAPMGVVWEMPSLVIRPYTDTTTYGNLRTTREGVVNLTDNVLLFAQSALSNADLLWHPSHRVRGAILQDACGYCEVVVDDIQDAGARASVRCHVMEERWMRPFLGFNRARNAVIEAAILATRLPRMLMEDVLRELQRHAQIVEKTGGERERTALALIERYVDAWIASPPGAKGA